MKHLFRVPVLVALAVGIVAFPLAAGAGHTTDPHTQNLSPSGHILEPASLINPAVGNPDVHTDIAFRGKFAIQGNWDGFNIRNINNAGQPEAGLGGRSVEGGQGDVVVFKNLVVRTWNAPASGHDDLRRRAGAGRVRGPAHLRHLATRRLRSSSARSTCRAARTPRPPIPDRKNNRLFDLQRQLEHAVPVDRHRRGPARGSGLREPDPERASDHTCHDIGVILGGAMKAACAGGEGVRVFSLGGKNGGSLEDPLLLYHVVDAPASPSATRPHGAGTARSSSSATSPAAASRRSARRPITRSTRTYFFYNGDDGREGRPVDDDEDAVRDRELHAAQPEHVPAEEPASDVLVHGSYQSGHERGRLHEPGEPAVELAWSDPPPIVPTDLGGAWSSYWYNDFIYETNITEGLNIFRVHRAAGERRTSTCLPEPADAGIHDQGQAGQEQVALAATGSTRGRPHQRPPSSFSGLVLDVT